MIVYVESNFVLELALVQEQVAAAEMILQIAEAGRLVLVLPAFALSEPFSSVAYRGANRERLRDTLDKQVRELSRSGLHQQLAAQLHPVLPILAQVRKSQMDSLEQTVERLLTVAHQAPLDLLTFQQARRYEAHYDLTPQDAIIYAATLSHLQQQPASEPKVFINRNVKDFDDLDIKAELQSYGCRYIGSFDDGLLYIQNQVQKGPPP